MLNKYLRILLIFFSTYFLSILACGLIGLEDKSEIILFVVTHFLMWANVLMFLPAFVLFAPYLKIKFPRTIIGVPAFMMLYFYCFLWGGTSHIEGWPRKLSHLTYELINMRQLGLPYYLFFVTLVCCLVLDVLDKKHLNNSGGLANN